MQELVSFPRKTAGKLVVAGQDKYMNNMSTKNKNLKLLQSLAGCNLKLKKLKLSFRVDLVAMTLNKGKTEVKPYIDLELFLKTSLE